ncbi:hypothetical protein, partial [Escherichia coli]|uniref:hypothetical protein n=1 Tax=Escherichia coli TaxID=562 RepID=UPI001F4A3E36
MALSSHKFPSAPFTGGQFISPSYRFPASDGIRSERKTTIMSNPFSSLGLGTELVSALTAQG